MQHEDLPEVLREILLHGWDCRNVRIVTSGGRFVTIRSNTRQRGPVNVPRRAKANEMPALQ